MSSIDSVIEHNRTRKFSVSSINELIELIDRINRTQSNRIHETRSIADLAIRRLDAIDPGIERKFWYSYKIILSNTKC